MNLHEWPEYTVVIPNLIISRRTASGLARRLGFQTFGPGVNTVTRHPSLERYLAMYHGLRLPEE
jgi:hypothetical protein